MLGWPFTTLPSIHSDRSTVSADRNRAGSHGRGGGNTYVVCEIEDITYISIGIVPYLGCFFQQSAKMRDLMICLMIKGG